jgi:hypothetical protein
VKRKWVLIVTVLVATVICGLGGVYVMGSGIKHSVTVSAGTKADPTTQWNAEHDYDPSLATDAFKVVWKDLSGQALVDSDRTSTIDFTDLDLTSYTSSDTKLACLLLSIKPDTVGAGDYCSLRVRKNGQTAGVQPVLFLGKNEATVDCYYYAQVFVGVDSNQIMEYSITVGTGWQIDSWIYVLGYWE